MWFFVEILVLFWIVGVSERDFFRVVLEIVLFDDFFFVFLGIMFYFIEIDYFDYIGFFFMFDFDFFFDLDC